MIVTNELQGHSPETKKKGAEKQITSAWVETIDHLFTTATRGIVNRDVEKQQDHTYQKVHGLD